MLQVRLREESCAHVPCTALESDIWKMSWCACAAAPASAGNTMPASTGTFVLTAGARSCTHTAAAVSVCRSGGEVECVRRAVWERQYLGVRQQRRGGAVGQREQRGERAPRAVQQRVPHGAGLAHRAQARRRVLHVVRRQPASVAACTRHVTYLTTS